MIDVKAIPELTSMIIAWISLLFLYLIFKKYLYGPVSQMLEERREKIQRDINEAEDLREEAFILREDYEKSIDNAKNESQEILESARRRGEELKEDILTEARKEAENIIDRARKQIDMERLTALQGVYAEAGEMAVLIASKIMEEQMTIDNQQQLIDKFIDEVGNSKWQS